MIKTNTIVGIEKGKASLDFMSLDHACEDVVNGELLTLTGKMICDGEDGSQVVRRVTPFRGKETVIEVEPSDHRPYIESTPDGVELIVSSGDSSALDRISISVIGPRRASKQQKRRTMRHFGPFDHWPEKF